MMQFLLDIVSDATNMQKLSQVKKTLTGVEQQLQTRIDQGHDQGFFADDIKDGDGNVVGLYSFDDGTDPDYDSAEAKHSCGQCSDTARWMVPASKSHSRKDEFFCDIHYLWNNDYPMDAFVPLYPDEATRVLATPPATNASLMEAKRFMLTVKR